MSGYIGTAPVPQATQTRDSFTATSGQTSFATGGYTPNFLDVYLNGVKLSAADYTASNGSDVVLASGAATGDILEVVAYTAFDTANVTGATNFTVTGAFTSQGIDDNGNATAITIDSSENVFVGKTSAGLSTAGVQLDATGSGGFCRAETCLTLSRLSTDGSILDFRKDSTTVGSINSLSGRLAIGTGNTGLFFDSIRQVVTPHTITGNTYNTTIDLGRAAIPFKDAYLSGGVYLGGTGSANKLEDYEEGTWTPSSVAFTISSVPSAKYTKVGRLVTIHAYLEITSGNTNLAKITGLPFSCVSQGWAIGGLNFNNSNSTVTHPHVRVRHSESALDLKFGNDSTLNGTACDAGHIIFTVTYITNA